MGLILILVFISLALEVFAAQVNSSTYKQTVVISSGGESVNSTTYKQSVAMGIINSIINSSSFINRLGFFHFLLLADDQPCSTANQCEGGFCCSNLCKSSSCPTEGGGDTSGASQSGGGSAGGGGGGAFVRVNVTKEPTQLARDFTISISSIKEELALGDETNKVLKIKNTGTAALDFNFSVVTVDPFVSFSNDSFSLDPDQENIIGIKILGRRLGSYFGEIEVISGQIKKLIDIIIEIESDLVLFDVKLDIPPANKEVEQGGELKEQITLLNVGTARQVDVIPTYIIKDRRGNVIYESTETFAVEKQISYVKSIRIDKDLPPGDYLSIVELRYEDSFAVSSELFKVTPKGTIVEDVVKPNITLMLAFVFFVGLGVLAGYFLVPKDIFKKHKFKIRKRK